MGVGGYPIKRMVYQMEHPKIPVQMDDFLRAITPMTWETTVSRCQKDPGKLADMYILISPRKRVILTDGIQWGFFMGILSW